MYIHTHINNFTLSTACCTSSTRHLHKHRVGVANDNAGLNSKGPRIVKHEVPQWTRWNTL